MSKERTRSVDSSSRFNVSKLLLLGLLFHVVFIGSVFDCYFTSPVVHGMKRFRVGSAHAKRLVLIVGDGLRADLLFNLHPFPNVPDSPRIVAPYLRSIVEERGAFGISHTRVPTESRPGHVAIIGGMYEDVSAVTKGWKVNPVDFDSVFNQSSSTYSFGSPDILPMFARGATPGKVKEWSYHEDDEDFTKDATALDIWVLDHLEELFQNATRDAGLNAELRQDKVVIFLHLLGLDTTGHSYRPRSKEYMRNIQVVDDIVRRTEELMSKFYQDEDTSFIFTADHGMSEIGNHGDGHPDNTRTPLIAWGKGVRGPLPDGSGSKATHDSYSEPWGLSHLYRRDVEQADITSLMAALIDIDWPVNSVGVLPDVDPSRPGYLDSKGLEEEAVARAALVNAQAILEQYRVKHDMKKLHTLFYQPFEPLHQQQGEDDSPGASTLKTIEAHIADGSWQLAKQEASDLIHAGLRGLHYLQTYDRFLIRSIVTFAYVGWAAFASMYIFRPVQKSSSGLERYRTGVTAVSGAILAASWTAFALQKSPWTFYLYVSFPVYFWQQSLSHGAPGMLDRISKQSLVTSLLWGTFIVTATQAMVVGYTHRSVWSAGFVIMGLLWPVTWPFELKRHLKLAGSWTVLCAINAIFPLLSVNKTESLTSIFAGGAAIISLALIGLRDVVREVGTSERWRTIRGTFSLQVAFVLVTMLITASSVAHLQAKTGLPLVNQILGWLVLGAASLFPFTSLGSDPSSRSKVLRYFLGFGPAFVILSISVEGLFYSVFSACLVAWIEVERCIRGSQNTATPRGQDSHGQEQRRHQGLAPSSLTDYRFQPSDIRIAVMFLFFVQIAFFGTGNVASISSFYLAPVYRLIPIFNPFFMASLLLFKILAPYIMLGIAFSQLNKGLQLPPFSLLLVALTIVDGMTLTFFFKVQDTGSWLEIGQSITFFCIASLLLLWSAAISAAGELLMAERLQPRGKVE